MCTYVYSTHMYVPPTGAAIRDRSRAIR